MLSMLAGCVTRCALRTPPCIYRYVYVHIIYKCTYHIYIYIYIYIYTYHILLDTQDDRNQRLGGCVEHDTMIAGSSEAWAAEFPHKKKRDVAGICGARCLRVRRQRCVWAAAAATVGRCSIGIDRTAAPLPRAVTREMATAKVCIDDHRSTGAEDLRLRLQASALRRWSGAPTVPRNRSRHFNDLSTDRAKFTAAGSAA